MKPVWPTWAVLGALFRSVKCIQLGLRQDDDDDNKPIWPRGLGAPSSGAREKGGAGGGGGSIPPPFSQVGETPPPGGGPCFKNVEGKFF